MGVTRHFFSRIILNIIFKVKFNSVFLNVCFLFVKCENQIFSTVCEMEMLSRIKNTVSSLGTVLPGNPVTREYEIVDHIGSAGPSLLWKVYKGIKKSTKEEAAVFVLEKKQLEKYMKHDRDCILDIMKKGVAHLTRLRHPSILTVQHPLEESRESLAFATEPVFASLANILGNQENMPIPPPKVLKDFELFDVEIKYGLLQVLEGLAFLHNDVKMLHRNINPECIMLNKNGAWKLAGFDFCVQAINSQGSQEQFPFHELEIDRPPPCQPHLDYIAPECVLLMTCTTASDMFSFGSLIYSIYSKGKPLLNNCGGLAAIKQNFNQLKHMGQSTFNCLPPEAREHVKMLLNITPEVRPDAFQMSKLQIFEDVGVKTLQYLDSLYQWDNLQKSQFYKGLPQILAKMPKRVTLFRVLPCLVKEYPNAEMVPFVLPNVLLIAEESTKEEFQMYILQDMIPLFRLQEPVQVMLIFMQKMELLLTKCPQASINNYVLPMIYRALESDAQQIQELCLSIIPRFAGLIEYSAMKNALIPKIKKLCISTSYLSVRVNCLVCLGKLLEHLDKWLVMDEILPLLPQIPSKEPAVLMGILGILKLTMTHKKLGITKEVMATKTIPFLMPLSIENGLTLNQFNAIMSVVKEMVCRVEAEHKTKLEQLNSIRQEQSSTLEMTQIQPEGQGEFFPDFKQDTGPNYLDDVFKDLGISSYGSPTHQQKFNPPSSKSADFLFDSHSVERRKESSLSMEEKKKLAWEQEQHQMMKTQKSTPLAPSTFPSKVRTTTCAPPPPRDLTSSLINTNLASLCIGHKPPASLVDHSPFPVQQVMASPSSLSLNQPPVINSFSGPQRFSPGGSFMNQSSNMHSSSQFQSLPPMPQSQNIDLRSLDSLLPNIGNKPSLTLNQMTTTTTNASPFPSMQMGWNSSIPPATSPLSAGMQSLQQPSLNISTTPTRHPKDELKDLFG